VRAKDCDAMAVCGEEQAEEGDDMAA